MELKESGLYTHTHDHRDEGDEDDYPLAVVVAAKIGGDVYA